MTLVKAIEIRSRTGDEFLNTDPDEIDEADRLSVEALKRLKELRDHPRLYPIEPLPGETKE